jgi:hypothetical protein
MRGNPVMKAKRVTGPTPNTVLVNRVRLERCCVKGCDKPVAIVKVISTHKVKRACITHAQSLSGKQTRKYGTVGFRPAWFV